MDLDRIIENDSNEEKQKQLEKWISEISKFKKEKDNNKTEDVFLQENNNNNVYSNKNIFEIHACWYV